MIQEFLLRIITTNKRHSFLLIRLFYLFSGRILLNAWALKKEEEKIRSIIFQLEPVAVPYNKPLTSIHISIFGHCRQCQFVRISLILRPNLKYLKYGYTAVHCRALGGSENLEDSNNVVGINGRVNWYV